METSEPSKKNYSFFHSKKEIKQYEIWTVEWRIEVNHRFWILRLYAGVKGFGEYEILIDQITTVSGEALVEKVDELSDNQRIQLRRNLGLVLGFTI